MKKTKTGKKETGKKETGTLKLVLRGQKIWILSFVIGCWMYHENYL